MSSDNDVKIGRLFYTFPVGDDLSSHCRSHRPLPTMHGMYAGYATFYPSDLLLDFFTYGGAPGVPTTWAGTGSGVGAVYDPG